MDTGMKILVQKFGGTSVATLECMKQVREKVQDGLKRGSKVVAVLSARSGDTNKLLALADEWSPAPDKAECDVLVSTGEQVSISLFTMLLKDAGIRARSLLGGQIPVTTDDDFGRARILAIDSKTLRNYLDQYDVLVVAGFQGCTQDGRITTLGRGGSDTSAVALAASLDSAECEIYTDVDGVYTTDPTSAPLPAKWTAWPMRKCWKWPVWGPRFCISVPWNLPRNTKSLYACVPHSVMIPALLSPRRTPAWKLCLFPALPMTKTRPA